MLARRWQPWGWWILMALSLSLVVGWVVSRVWLGQGWLRPIRVSNSSMAPNLLGQHDVVQCLVCQRPYAIEPLDPALVDRRAVCPGCGSLHQVMDPIDQGLGWRVVIRNALRLGRHVDRWSVVAMRHPSRPKQWIVKRVVALPGESVRIHDGDVFVGGQRQAKSPDVLRELAIPLLDTKGIAAADRAPWSRWRPRESGKGWRLDAGGWCASSSATDAWCWLSFLGNELAGRRSAEALILDDYAFNVSLSRRLNPVRDILLRCRFTGRPAGDFANRLQIAGHDLQIIWNGPSGEISLSIDGRRLEHHRWASPDAAAFTWEMALCDGSIRLVVNQSQVLSMPLPESVLVPRSGVERIEIGVHRTDLCLEQIELLRDIYYVSAVDSGLADRDAFVNLTDTQYFVLGDNSPVSEDSRQWGPIDQSNLLGTVTRWSASR